MFEDFIVNKMYSIDCKVTTHILTFTCKIYFSLIPNTRVILYCRKWEHNGAK